ncbi:hypothetical protein ACJMK2_008763 [Sinanodonta woodiana]|uniref:Peptidase A2 domain-containing protein n=1 Tax=Sinanodonta woodiana TaxID=1069815 RepID=A0ABD3VMJ9_SINWO
MKEGPTDIMVSNVNDSNHGFFVCAKIQNYKVPLLVDTGASVTIISHKFKEKLSSMEKLHIKPVKLNLVTATGDRRPFLGKCWVDLSLGNQMLRHEVLIANIEQNGILGLDFMTRHAIE